MTNQELIERILKYDDEEAYKVFFHRMYGRLINFSIYYVKKVEIAEDVVSDVFVNFLRAKNKFDQIDNVEAFFYTAVKNQSHKYIRKKKTSDLLFTQASSEDYQIKSNIRPDLELINKELHEVLLNAMEQLPPQRKMIFQLVKFDGLKYSEVAMSLDISQKTVEKHMTLSLKIVREIVTDYLQDKGTKTKAIKRSLWLLSVSILVWLCTF
ncbi:RNA polymerase sigma-70 factor [Reichenbachiella sp. MALMAid0571]|uniref:RNA polymerase sigma-70 factor n=1 Tax=Reichenbachiella sp. MALMAid0571 TaxID=3143939 RepID=UPI0032DEED1E